MLSNFCRLYKALHKSESMAVFVLLARMETLNTKLMEIHFYWHSITSQRAELARRKVCNFGTKQTAAEPQIAATIPPRYSCRGFSRGADVAASSVNHEYLDELLLSMKCMNILVIIIYSLRSLYFYSYFI